MSQQASIPFQAEPRTLARASLAALAAGAAILVLFVLPAEYAIDPTGVGSALGLTRMAAGEDAVEEADGAPEVAQPPAPAAFTVPAQSEASIVKTTPYRDDVRTVTLAPHSGMEVKARMKAGDSFVFQWQASGPVRLDMHGEPVAAKADEFTSYWKQKDIRSAQGAFTAPFAGTHGWYWRNREEVPVTITVKTHGFYQELFEPK